MHEKKKQYKARKKFILKALRVAFKYYKWLNKNGVGSTYNRFRIDFSYKDSDALTMYYAVNAIHRIAREESEKEEPEQ